MKKKLLIALSTAALLTPFLAQAEGAVLQSTTDYARVLNVVPITGPEVAREVCRSDQESAPRTRERSSTGAVLGGLGGALVGSRFGDGNGKVAATIAGTVGGAILGDRYDNRDADRGEPMMRRCETVYEPGRLSGYQVTYEYQGQRGTVTMNRDPGDWVRVRKTVTIE